MSGQTVSDTTSDFARARREVEDLHAAFTSWMGVGGDPSVFARFEAAFAAGFSMVGPDGRRRDRAAVLDMLRGARGAFGDGFAIRIDACTPLAAAPGVTAIGYDEIQSGRPGPTHRRATALLLHDPAGPNGMRWLAVHETWVS